MIHHHLGTAIEKRIKLKPIFYITQKKRTNSNRLTQPTNKNKSNPHKTARNQFEIRIPKTLHAHNHDLPQRIVKKVSPNATVYVCVIPVDCLFV